MKDILRFKAVKAKDEGVFNNYVLTQIFGQHIHPKYVLRQTKQILIGHLPYDLDFQLRANLFLNLCNISHNTLYTKTIVLRKIIFDFPENFNKPNKLEIGTWPNRDLSRSKAPTKLIVKSMMNVTKKRWSIKSMMSAFTIRPRPKNDNLIELVTNNGITESVLDDSEIVNHRTDFSEIAGKMENSDLVEKMLSNYNPERLLLPARYFILNNLKPETSPVDITEVV